MKIESEKSSPMNLDPEARITAELVDRVSQRVAMGIPLRLALAGEPVSCVEYEEHLRKHPELAVLEDVAKRRFLENAMNILLNGENAAGNFRWLIELVYSGIIASPKESEPAKPKEQPGPYVMSEEYLKMLQEEAKKL